MNNQDHGLDRAWPRIAEEIARARRRKARGRQASRWATVSAAAGLAAVVAIAGGARSQRTTGAYRPWDLADIVPAGNVSPEYPLVSGKLVFAVRGGSRNGHVACIRKESGNVAWEIMTPFSECRLACDGRQLYVLYREPAAAWRCAAYDARTGKELWRQPAGEAGDASPSMMAVVRGGVAWSRGNRLILCSAKDGRTLWSRTAERDETLSAPRAQGGAVFAVSASQAYAFRADSGKLLWRYSSGPRTDRTRKPGLMELSEGRVFAALRTASGRGSVACLDADTGVALWTAPAPMPLRLQVAHRQVLVRSASLNALDARTGAPLWNAPVGGCGPISVRKDRLYVIDAADRRELVALDSHSGRAAWRRKAAASCSGVVADGGMGFISGSDGILHALALN